MLPGSAGARAQVNGLARDGAGDLVISGSFGGTRAFNPSGGDSLAAGGTDAFVAMFGPTGSGLWARQFHGNGSDLGAAVALDGAGNVLATGTYAAGTAVGPIALPGAGGAYVAKLDGNGNVLWADGFAGDGPVSGKAIAVDDSGQVYAAGIDQGDTAFLGKGGTSATLSAPPGVSSAYLARLGADGSVAWAVSFAGASGNTAVGGLAVDASGSVLVDGTISGPTRIGDRTISTPSGVNNSAFVARVGPDGRASWAEPLAGTDSVFGTALGLDGAGNMYVGGDFDGTLAVPGGVAPLASSGGTDAFVAKLDPYGRGLWAVRAGGTGNDTVGALAIRAADDVAVAGRYVGPADFGASALQTIESTNAYIGHISTPTAPTGAAALDFHSAVDVGGGVLDARATVLDASGNAYVTGFFGGTVDFDPGPGVSDLTSSGVKDAFLAAYTPSGALLWVKDIPGASVQGNGLAIDAKGDLFLAGTFSGTVGKLASAGDTDAFLAEYDPSGNPIRAVAFGGARADQGSGVAVDAAGNVTLVGTFNGSASFGGTTLNGAGGSDAFLVQLSPDFRVRWATAIGGNGLDSGNRVAVDGAGEVYALGTYTGSFAAGSQVVPGTASLSTFVAKFSPDGRLAWVDGLAGAPAVTAGDLAVDARGDAFAVGTFAASANFAGISLAPSGSGAGRNAYALEIDPSGRASSAHAIGGTSSTLGAAVRLDRDGAVYVGGEFDGTVNFGAGASSTLTSFGYLDAFVAKLGPNGDPAWARQAGGPGNDYVTGLAVLGPDDLALIGRDTGPATFGNAILPPVDGTSIYLARLDSGTPALPPPIPAGSSPAPTPLPTAPVAIVAPAVVPIAPAPTSQAAPARPSHGPKAMAPAPSTAATVGPVGASRPGAAPNAISRAIAAVAPSVRAIVQAVRHSISKHHARRHDRRVVAPPFARALNLSASANSGACGGSRTCRRRGSCAGRRTTRSRSGRRARASPRRGSGPWRTRTPTASSGPTPSKWPRSTMNGRGAISAAISA